MIGGEIYIDGENLKSIKVNKYEFAENAIIEIMFRSEHRHLVMSMNEKNSV